MSGFNLSELLPFYLDETDENIAALNDSLLRLEEDPSDAKALAEAFRMFHSIKGASVVMGFAPVNRLTHNLESLYDQLRNKKRTLDRPVLDLTFRCLDELRDYHRELRSGGQSERDLSGLVVDVEAAVKNPSAPPAVKPSPPAAPAPTPPPTVVPVAATSIPADDAEIVRVTVEFEPDLPLVDMKARLVANRLASRARVVTTQPPIEQLEEVESLAKFVVWVTGGGDFEELRSLADVGGVARVHVEIAPLPQPGSAPEAAAEPKVEPAPAAASVPEPEQAAVAGESEPEPQAQSEVEPAAPAPTHAAGGAKKAKIAETIRVDSDRLDYLMNLAGELVINKARFVDIAKSLDEVFRGPNVKSLANEAEERLDAILRGLDQVLGASGSRAGGATSSTSPTTAVASNGSVDRWAGQVRRLRDDFREIGDQLDRLRQGRDHLKTLSEAIHNLGRVTDGLQKGVLDTRMVPIGPLFERFRRVIRDLSHASGKEVVLKIGGEKTELDKRMIDELSDPLIHMVRNSVDHGLEPPDVREAAGKPRAGTVHLHAAQRGNSVVITVSDDGRGIDCERIRRKIAAKGLVSQAQAAAMTDRELVPYIWHPGLSTAETITEVSGRGVGMDIVKNRIDNLSGGVDVRTTLGQGTVFSIRLPLTLAIMSSLLVRIDGEVYALPLDHIDEIVEISARQVFPVQGRPTIEIRKKIIALVSLGDLFHWGGERGTSASDLVRLDDGRLRVVIVQNGETTIGLIVDQMIGMQEVVLKSLEKNYRSVSGLSGASILGDGRVSLILDVDAVVGLAAR